MSNGSDVVPATAPVAEDATADATSTVGAITESAQSPVAADNAPAAHVILEYRDTPGPLTRDVLIALEQPRPQAISVEGRAWVYVGSTSDGRLIYGSV